MLKVAQQRRCLFQVVSKALESRALSISLPQSCSESAQAVDLTSYDKQQLQYLSEPCILVNEYDENLGQSASKKECHLLSNIKQGMLHRAFSVFLFNTKNELLLQQRSDAKITFPGMFTNTCCSHPLYTDLEMDEKDAMGVKRAAQRKLFHELGITPDQIPLNTFTYLTRIMYQADNVPRDGRFGENEIDYVLIIRKDVDLAINVNEVKSVEYVSQSQLKGLLKMAEEGNFSITPWFQLICEHFLFQWWEKLDKLKDFQDHKTIHRL